MAREPFNALMRNCDLSAWDGEARTCRWCNTGLMGLARAWCSEACRDEAYGQHIWAYAVSKVLLRDRGCVQCGAGGERALR